MLNGYKYETHLHTSEGSLCARGDGASMARFMKEQGYSGICVTDHFFNGNTAVSRDLPWSERVNLYCLGYEHAKEEGKKIGLDVFFGVEWNFCGDEYLIYGVTKEWLLENPGMLEWSHRELYEEVEKAGAVILQAHPFRDRGYIPRINLYPQLVHGIEVTNAGNKPLNDRMADAYAAYYGFPVISGSDLHGTEVPQRGLRGVISGTRWNDITDFIKQIKTFSGYRIITSEDSSGIRPEDCAEKEMRMWDKDEKDITALLERILKC